MTAPYLENALSDLEQAVNCCPAGFSAALGDLRDSERPIGGAPLIARAGMVHLGVCVDTVTWEWAKNAQEGHPGTPPERSRLRGAVPDKTRRKTALQKFEVPRGRQNPSLSFGQFETFTWPNFELKRSYSDQCPVENVKNAVLPPAGALGGHLDHAF